jgi:hypothetical protein
MMPPSHIVLDKSYLQACANEDLQEILERYRLIVCAETFYEVISTQEAAMRSCLGKLMAYSDFVDLLDHHGTLLKYETDNRRPCTPLSAHFLPGRINPSWNYKFSDDQTDTIADFQDYWEVTGPKEFDEVVRSIVANCGRVKPEDVGRDKDVVLSAYSQLRVSERLPPPNIIDDTWAMYRRLQVELIAAYEYMCSFQDGQFHIRQDRKAHNQLDFRIVVVASLAGGLATRDRLMKRYFEIICPEGVLYWLGDRHKSMQPTS